MKIPIKPLAYPALCLASVFLLTTTSVAQYVMQPPPCQPHEWAPVFFDEPSTRTTSPLVLRVTVTRLLSGTEVRNGIQKPAFGDRSIFAEAQVVQIIKGSVEGDKVHIDASMTRCPIKMKIGDSGIIRGQIRPLDIAGRTGAAPRVVVQINRPVTAN
jgi:hypothetical protein